MKENEIQHIISVSLYTILLCSSLTLLTSCSDDFIDPFQNDERFFTVYGYIDAREISHEIRVIPVTRHQAVIVRESDIQARLDAEVTIADLTTGEVVEWVYNLEKLEDGTFAHIFRTEFVVIPGRRYRLDVTRSDGVRAWAQTRVPNIADSAFYELGPVNFSADSSEVSQEVLIRGDLNPWRFEAIYSWRGDLFNRRVFVPYGRRGSANGSESWTTSLSISDDQSTVFETIKESLRAGKIMDDTPLILTTAGLRMTMLDTNWKFPETGFDLNELTLPETTTNINNGYGFFGSIGYYVQEWEACELSGPLGYEFAEENCGDRDEPE